MAYHIVLHEPEIPANTGNIGRTCLATNTELHLVHPLGFSTEDRYVRRAGMDYWPQVCVHHYDSFAEVVGKYAGRRFFCATTKAKHAVHEFTYQDGDFFVFGKESAGLPPEILDAHQDTLIRIPMTGQVRSLNLSNAAAIVLYEAFRQNHFPGLNV